MDMVILSFPKLSFENIISYFLTNQLVISSSTVFKTASKAYGLSRGMIAQKSLFYYNARLLKNGVDDYPNPSDAYNTIKYVYPETDHFQTIATLTNEKTTYNLTEIASAIPIGAFNQTGLALESTVAPCLTEIFTDHPENKFFAANQRIKITINPDATTYSVADIKRCHKLFYEKMRSKGLTREKAEVMLLSRFESSISGSSLFGPASDVETKSILLAAGYPEPKTN